MENIREGSVCKKGTILFALFMFLVLVPLSAQAKETDRHVTIYGLGSTVQDKISIPADLPQSYQIPAGGGERQPTESSAGNRRRFRHLGLSHPNTPIGRDIRITVVLSPKGKRMITIRWKVVIRVLRFGRRMDHTPLP